MTPSRRGFFATLAALPAVVMGRKAIAAPDDGLTWTWYPSRPLHVKPERLQWSGLSPVDVARVRRELPRIIAEYEQHTGRRLGS